MLKSNEYDEKSSVLSMEWFDCYLWDGENQNYDIPEDMLKCAFLDHLEIEDDAPEYYSPECFACITDGNDIVVKRRTQKKGRKIC